MKNTTKTQNTLSKVIVLVGLAIVGAAAAEPSMREQVTVANWDKDGTLSHWVYTHASEVFPAGVVRRGGAILELPKQVRPAAGQLFIRSAVAMTSNASNLVTSCVCHGNIHRNSTGSDWATHFIASLKG